MYPHLTLQVYAPVLLIKKVYFKIMYYNLYELYLSQGFAGRRPIRHANS